MAVERMAGIAVKASDRKPAMIVKAETITGRLMNLSASSMGWGVGTLSIFPDTRFPISRFPLPFLPLPFPFSHSPIGDSDLIDDVNHVRTADRHHQRGQHQGQDREVAFKPRHQPHQPQQPEADGRQQQRDHDEDRKQSQSRSAMKTSVSGRKSRRSPLTDSVERHCVNGSPAK